jgi:hypothetical protein
VLEQKGSTLTLPFPTLSPTPTLTLTLIRTLTQIGRTRDEIAHQRKNIDILRAAIDAKNAPLQLATTRLATRAGRPGIERTSDAAHHALVDEAESLVCNPD